MKSITILSVMFVSFAFVLSMKAVHAYTVSLTPVSSRITMDDSVIFTSTILGGASPYTYAWFINGSLAGWNSSSALFVPAIDGSFSIYLQVTDYSNITTNSNMVTVLVDPPIPQAEFTFAPASALAGQTTYFDGSLSTAGANVANITGFLWTFGDGAIASGASVTHVFSVPGIYYVTLNVTNCFGYTNALTKSLIVTGVPVGGYSIETQPSGKTDPKAIFLALVVAVAIGIATAGGSGKKRKSQ